MEQCAALSGSGLHDSDAAQGRESREEGHGIQAEELNRCGDELDGAQVEPGAGRTEASATTNCGDRDSRLGRAVDVRTWAAQSGALEDGGGLDREGVWQSRDGAARDDASVPHVPARMPALDVLPAGSSLCVAMCKRGSELSDRLAGTPRDGDCAGHPSLPSMPARGSGHGGAHEPHGLPMPELWRPDAGFGVDTSAAGTLPEWGFQSSGDAPATSSTFQLIGWGCEEQEKTLAADLVDLGDIVNLSQAMVYWCNGSQVPSMTGMRCASPIGTRVIASSSGKDRWNLLNIDRQPTEPYELQAWMTTLVVQELKEDFVVYVRDIDLDPVEVTLDKSIKKELAAAIDRKIGAMDGFYDICEEGLDVCLDHHEIPGDVDGVESAWPHVDRQGTYLPVDLDLNWLIKDSEEVNWMEVWRTSDAGDTAACCDLSPS